MLDADQGPTAAIEGRGSFRDRVEAGKYLARSLAIYRDKQAMILGIARGGIQVAAEVARDLGGDLDVIVARKIGVPGQQELALGAVTAHGPPFFNEEILGELSPSKTELDALIKHKVGEASARELLFRGSATLPEVKGRIVIVVDDGLATGATAHAAVCALRAEQPEKLILAAPVGSPRTCLELAHEVDDVVCPFQPEVFYAIGQFYDRFEQLSDQEVRRILLDFRGKREP